MPKDAPEALGAALVLRDGRSTPLRALWADGPTALVFLRHYGCMGCSLLLAELGPRLPELSDLGVAVVLVGHGPPALMGDFASRYGLDAAARAGERGRVEVVHDPTGAAFAAAGMVRSWWGAVGPAALRDLLRGWAAGHPNHMRGGDLAQQGGAVVLDGDGRVVWTYAADTLGDHAPAVEIVEVALRLAASGAAWKT